MAYLIISDTKTASSKVIDLVNTLQNTSFTEIEQILNNPEIVTLGFETNTKIGIDTIKELQSKMSFKPISSPFSIGVIFNANKMTTEAQNAMLKTLEEHSENSEYILVVNNERNILDTITSRCKKYYTSRVIKLNDIDILNESEIIITPKELLNLELADQFAYTDKIIDLEKSNANAIGDFLHQIGEYLKSQLQNSIENENMHIQKELIIAISRLDTAKVRIEANTNKKLVLENLLLQLKSLK